MAQALIIIDVQNDYFPDGKLPLWNTKTALDNIEKAILEATRRNIPIILIQQFTDPKVAPFFNKGTKGAEIHSRIMNAAPEAKIITKNYADSFHETELDQVLKDYGARKLLVCGMMTQNCVTHTAISKSAEKYEVLILSDCCTTVSSLIHNIALRAVSTRLALATSEEVFG